MGSKTFVGKLSSVLALLLPLALLSLVTASPVSTSTTAAPPLEPWRAPCTTGSQTTASVTAILGNLKDAVGDVKTAAEAWKDLLTDTDNPRVNRQGKALCAYVHVDKFPPLPFVARHSKSNSTALLTRDYRTLSGLYAFLQRCQNNSRRCDTRRDASLIQTQMGSILHKLLVALCQLNKHLTAMGRRPGLAVQIPGKAELLGEGVEEEEEGSGLRVMHDDEDCEGPLGSYRDLVDYMIARDTVRVLQRLSVSYRKRYHN